MTVKTHRLKEILAKRLFGIDTVPKNAINRMKNSAIKAGADYHDKVILEKDERIEELEGLLEDAVEYGFGIGNLNPKAYDIGGDTLEQQIKNWRSEK